MLQISKCFRLSAAAYSCLHSSLFPALSPGLTFNTPTHTNIHNNKCCIQNHTVHYFQPLTLTTFTQVKKYLCCIKVSNNQYLHFCPSWRHPHNRPSNNLSNVWISNRKPTLHEICHSHVSLLVPIILGELPWSIDDKPCVDINQRLLVLGATTMISR